MRNPLPALWSQLSPCWSIFYILSSTPLGFPGGSDGKESACNAGDLGSIPGLGRSLGEEKGFPLQYSDLETGEFHGLYSPLGRKKSDATERLSLSLHPSAWALSPPQIFSFSSLHLIGLKLTAPMAQTPPQDLFNPKRWHRLKSYLQVPEGLDETLL